MPRKPIGDWRVSQSPDSAQQAGIEAMVPDETRIASELHWVREGGGYRLSAGMMAKAAISTGE
jgi:hypothetical protein